MNTAMLPPMLVLGAGYVGRQLLAANPNAIGTRRHNAGQSAHEIAFDLADRGTWGNIDVSGRHVVWTFPAVPRELVEEFHAHLRSAASLIILGSTSAYEVTVPDQLIDENAPLDMAQPRVAGEEWLRARGAMVLHLAGIFGPGREPVRWLEKGLIKNGRKRVNLIHVADIVDVILALARGPQPGLRLNVSNGKAPAWQELVETFRERGWLPPNFCLPEVDPGTDNKRIDCGLLQSLFPGKTWLVP